MKKQIVCLSPQYWNELWFRKQQFMLRFQDKGYKVAFINPSLSLIKRPRKSERDYTNNRLFKVDIDKIENNLFIVSPPKYLPFWSRSFCLKTNLLYTYSRISFNLRKLGFRDYILWLYRAEDIHSRKYFNYEKIVFDICDDLPAHNEKKMRKYHFIENCTNSLVKESDLVLVTVQTMFEKYSRFTSNIHLIPNGYDSDLFSRNYYSPPEEILNVPLPIVGFVGTLFSFLDYDLIEYVVRKNPEKTFVFVGPCKEEVKKRWDEVLNYSNVVWLGKRDKEQIPSIIKRFDVCINPFRVDNISKSVSPLKVFEYLAMRKPVVSVSMKALAWEKIGKLIHFAKNYDEFNDFIDFSLKNKIPESNYNSLKDYSWNSLFNRVFLLLEDYFF